MCKIAQSPYSRHRIIDRDAVCHPVGHALRDEWATVPDSCVVRVLPIVRLLIQGSCGPVGNASEPLLFTVGPVAAGLRSPAQPCLSYPLTRVCKIEIIATNRPHRPWIPAYAGMTEWAR